MHERGRIDKAFCNEREARKRAQELNNKFSCFDFYYRKIEFVTDNKLGKNREEIGNDLAIRRKELIKELDKINKKEN